FQFVSVQPVLPDVDPRILQYRGSIGSEAVSDFGTTDAREERPSKREQSCEDSSKERSSLAFPSREESRSLYVVKSVLGYGFSQSRDFPRIVLTIACHYDDQIESSRERIPVASLDRKTYSISRLILDNRDRNLGFPLCFPRLLMRAF